MRNNNLDNSNSRSNVKANGRKVRKLRWDRVLLLLSAIIIICSFSFTAAASNEEVPTVETVVQYGDSIWSLVKEYNPEYKGDMNKAIYITCQLNNLDNCYIYQGQTLIIPINL